MSVCATKRDVGNMPYNRVIVLPTQSSAGASSLVLLDFVIVSVTARIISGNLVCYVLDCYQLEHSEQSYLHLLKS